MASNPTVSVIMAVYNRETYIALSVRSVLDQTYNHFELIVCDDGSTDDTYQILDEFSNDPRLRVLRHEKNQGGPSGLNSCLAVATGDYVAVIDSDDIWVAEKLSRQVKYMSDNPAVSCVYSKAQLMDESGEVIEDDEFHFFCGDWSGIDDRAQWLRFLFYNYRMPLCHSSFLGKRNCVNDVGGYDARFNRGFDYYLFLKIVSRFEVRFIAEPLVKYRIHTNNLSKPSKTDRQIRSHGKIIAYKEFLDNPDIRRLWPEIFPECVRFAAYLKDDIQAEHGDIMMMLILVKLASHQKSDIRELGLSELRSRYKDKWSLVREIMEVRRREGDDDSMADEKG